MRNVPLSPLKSVYVAVGSLVLASAIFFAVAESTGFSIGHLALFLLGLGMLCLGVVVDERKLARVSFWLIIFNMVCAGVWIFYH